MKKLFMLACCFAAFNTALAADQIAARKEVFEQYKKTMSAMGQMVKGDTPFSQADFAKLAAHLDELAQQPWQYFGPGSDKGKTDARPEIWSQPAEFQSAIGKHKHAAQSLKQAATVARNIDDVKPAFIAIQQTCKSCHQQFRND
ncbi:cytochrome c [Vogesella sp. LIG4]|uniref:c-type cytochrome n=1 Tax=Vogesella sp. LIG4 TaxID=1192162 RepID=UPI00081F8F5E|nr:cytochrome c [Vogesella sp. LIG4]SCK26366.1 Cytochrome c556 [Vogesella sp. LIG4]